MFNLIINNNKDYIKIQECDEENFVITKNGINLKTIDQMELFNIINGLFNGE